MSDSAWYLISYDIRDIRRLRQVHRVLKACAHPLLESLFAFQGSPRDLIALHQRLTELLQPAIDDLLIYRLRHDRPIHRWGTACLPPGLYDFSLPPLIEHRDERIKQGQNWSNFTQLSDQKTISLLSLATS
jgi:CRISPR/Cas system-associated endoribonuclease Cas2